MFMGSVIAIVIIPVVAIAVVITGFMMMAICISIYVVLMVIFKLSLVLASSPYYLPILFLIIIVPSCYYSL